MHAAGLHSPENSGLGNKLSDFAVSSYSPSLISLLNGHKTEKGKEKNNQFLAVALPAQSRLPGTGTEIEKLKVHIGHFPLLELLESKATIEAVTTGLQKSSWVHFACHGIQDISNPTESALLLAEHSQLTLSTISNLLLPNAQMVFLSACQTATGDKDLADEAVHLAAGMLLAGFCGAIGTMWSISDHDAPEVADSVYAHILKDNNPDAKQAAYALHVAIRKLQKRNVSYFSWVPFIHLGV
jgi:CHAT domain-containing protein